MPYIDGDPRFGKIKKGTRNMVNLWARKEFTNMALCYKRGIPVPEPIQVSKNVIASRFVGSCHKKPCIQHRYPNPSKSLLLEYNKILLVLF